MVKKISFKEHWEDNMNKNSLLPYIKAVKNFEKTEFYTILKKYIKDGGKKKKFFEIGAAPGLYGIIFNQYFNYIPGGIEYTKNGYNSILELNKVFNIKINNYIKGDFFLFKEKKQYDLVFSGGFIEHFDDYTNVIIKHFDITTKKGTIVITLPNYHFFFRNFQEFLYPGLMTIQHNREIMNLDTFIKTIQLIEKEGNINIKYIGSFGKSGFGQLVSKNKYIQKSLYLIDIICCYTMVYYFFPREASNLIAIIEKK